jgi:hypothetical protein
LFNPVENQRLAEETPGMNREMSIYRNGFPKCLDCKNDRLYGF